MENGSRGWPRRHASHKRDDAQRRRRAAHMIALPQLLAEKGASPGETLRFQPCSSPSAAASSIYCPPPQLVGAQQRRVAPRALGSLNANCVWGGRECPTKTFIKRTLWSTARTHLPSLRRSLAGVCVCVCGRTRQPAGPRPTPTRRARSAAVRVMQDRHSARAACSELSPWLAAYMHM